MFRALAPSGVPIKPSEIFSGLIAMLSGQKAVDAFNREISETYGARYVTTVSSGRAGLSLMFKAFHGIYPDRHEVLIPAFTSYSVPSAVVHAGLKVSLYDLEPSTLSADIQSLAHAITDRTLCIVVCHLFGFPADMDAILEIAQAKNIPVIDDAAQAMGAVYKGQAVGTLGTAGLFSLSRGKNITAVDGGVVITNDEKLAQQMASLEIEKIGAKETLKLIVMAIVLSFLQHPRCYWIPRSIKSLNIGASVFDPYFSITGFTAFQAGIARHMLKRLGKINIERRMNAEQLLEMLSGSPNVKTIDKVDGGEPVYLRFPVITTVGQENLGQGVVGSYPTSIFEIRGIAPHISSVQTSYSGAQLLAGSILTLPTHSYVTDEDCRCAVQSVNGVV